MDCESTLESIRKLEKSVRRSRWLALLSCLVTLLCFANVRFAPSLIAQPVSAGPPPVPFDKVTAHQVVIINGNGQQVMSLDALTGIPRILMGNPNSNITITPLLIEQRSPSGAIVSIGFARGEAAPSIGLGSADFHVALGFSNNRPSISLLSSVPSQPAESVVLTSNSVQVSNATLTGNSLIISDTSQQAATTINANGLIAQSQTGKSALVANPSVLGLAMLSSDGNSGLRFSVDADGISAKSKNAGQEQDWPNVGVEKQTTPHK